MRPSLTPGGSRRSRLAASRMPPRQHTLALSSVCTATWTLLVQSQKGVRKKALPSLRSDTRATAVQAHNTATLLPPEVVHGGWTCGETREVRQNGPVCREAVVRGPRCAVVRPPATGPTFFVELNPTRWLGCCCPPGYTVVLPGFRSPSAYTLVHGSSFAPPTASPRPPKGQKVAGKVARSRTRPTLFERQLFSTTP